MNSQVNQNGCLLVKPGHPLIGELPRSGKPAVPGDKSLSHRAAILASMAAGRSQIENFLVSGVTRVMLDGLIALGVQLDLQGNTLTVQGCGLKMDGSHLSEPGKPLLIDCGNSATTLRLLAGLISAWGQPAVLDGSAGLRRRPMQRIVEPLQRMGVPIESSGGCAPLVISPGRRPLQSIDYILPVASAQVKSCLLVAGLAADGACTFIEPAPSRDHTERMLVEQGVRIEKEVIMNEGRIAYLTRLYPRHADGLKSIQMKLPSDFSAAAFLIVAALITPGSEICLRAVGLNPARTGLLDALWEMGAQIHITHPYTENGEPAGDIYVRYSSLQGTQVKGEMVVRMIDEFLAFAIAAACAQTKTTVSEAGELRHKESDRIGAIAQELNKLGINVSETPDGFIIEGGQPLQGGESEAHGDHRLAMALAVAGLAARSPVVVKGAESIQESFPGFALALQTLGAEIEFLSCEQFEEAKVR